MEISGKKVIVRVDLDLGEGEETFQNPRVNTATEMIRYLFSNGALKVTVLAHRGRPQAFDEKLSLKNISDLLKNEFSNNDLTVLENLRFDKREEENSEEYAKELSQLGDVYVNEAFAVSHRKHTSVYALPLLMKQQGKPVYLGLRFQKEVEMLNKVFGNSRPIVAIISGTKEDKVKYAQQLTNMVDKVLVAGRLPDMFDWESNPSEKLLVAKLNPDKEDITLNSIASFKTEIVNAKTIIIFGVPGKYEDEGHRQGTKEIFEAVANASAFKVVGGGDSLVALQMFGLENKFDWISIGGGASLEFLINKTLPGMKAV